MMPPPVTSLVELLRFRALTQPEQRAYVFLDDGERPGRTLTYAQVDLRARTIAASLEGEAEPGDRVLLVIPAGLEFIEAFFGCLYAGLIAVPIQAPHPARLGRIGPHLDRIAQDAGASVVFTIHSLVESAEAIMELAPTFRAARWLAVDGLQGYPANPEATPAIDGRSVALLQYTSGSTAAPRGVMVTHDNLLHNLAAIEQCVDHDTQSVSVSWLPPFHDMGLIGGILSPVFGGYPAWLMSPAAFLQRPVRWLEAISRLRATFSGGPNFAYDLCLERTTPSQRAALDLRAWRYAFNGAEPVRAGTLDRFADAFAVAGFRREAFRPVYGLAESTLLVSAGGRRYAPAVKKLAAAALSAHQAIPARLGQDKVANVVACGPPAPAVGVEIVDPEHRTLRSPGEIGEVWVRSPSVAQGYWRNPGATSQIFHARLADTGQGPFLRTGDMGFRADGELFITGRLKDLIVVRGRKHYPQDIEATVEQSHPAIRSGGCAAFLVATAEDGALAVAVEIEPRSVRQVRVLPCGVGLSSGTSGSGEIMGAIRQAVSEIHELQLNAVVLVAPGAIPKTTSGKVRRQACRDAYATGAFAALAEWRGQTMALASAQVG